MFDGDTYQPELDIDRLKSQLDRVRWLMEDGEWRTLAQIQGIIGGSESGISARLRDLRKEKFGSYIVNRRHRGEPSFGLFEYQLIHEDKKPEFKLESNGQVVFI